MSTRVLPGDDNLSTYQVTVDSTGTTLVSPARKNREAVMVTNLGTTDVYLGNLGVSSSNGDLLVGTKGASVVVPYNGDLYGATAGGTQAVSVLEVF